MLIGTEDAVRSLRLEIVGFQYPGAQKEDGDWLVVAADVRKTPDLHWRFVEPCLTLSEADRLASWLEGAARQAIEPVAWDPDDDDSKLLCFTEPNLAFRVAGYTGSGVLVAVHLSAESLPPGSARPYDLFAYHLVIPVDRAHLETASAAWRRDLDVLAHTGRGPGAAN